MSTLDSSFKSDSNLNKGLLYKLLTRLPNKSDIPGLEYHSSTVGRLFKSGFGRFGLRQAKPHLSDQDVIMVFVVGGINGLEVMVNDAIAKILGVFELLVGILHVKDLFSKYLCSRLKIARM